MRKFLKNQKGVTMIEVLVTIAILAIVVTPCLSAFVMAQRGNVKAAETKQAYTAAANLMEELKGGTPKTIEEIIEEQGANKLYDAEKNITVFFDKEEGTQYYVVSIYTGEHSSKPDSDVEPIVKGVIAHD